MNKIILHFCTPPILNFMVCWFQNSFGLGFGCTIKTELGPHFGSFCTLKWHYCPKSGLKIKQLCCWSDNQVLSPVADRLLKRQQLSLKKTMPVSLPMFTHFLHIFTHFFTQLTNLQPFICTKPYVFRLVKIVHIKTNEKIHCENHEDCLFNATMWHIKPMIILGLYSQSPYS